MTESRKTIPVGRDMNQLRGKRDASLVNLGPKRLFLGADGDRVNRFVEALGIDERSHFMKATWPDLLANNLGDLPK
jgi:hypothetical protein